MPARLYTTGRARSLSTGIVTQSLLAEAREAQKHCAEEFGDWTAVWEHELPTVLDTHDELFLSVRSDGMRIERSTQEGRCPVFFDIDITTLPDRDDAIFEDALAWMQEDVLVEEVAPQDEATVREWRADAHDRIWGDTDDSADTE